MITQAMGLQLATPHEWRIVLLFSAVLSVVQLLLSPAIVESPSWLHRHGLLQEKAAATRRLWTVEEATPSCKCSHLPEHGLFAHITPNRYRVPEQPRPVTT